nr:hypothetical protein [uncultured Undibacterium sp.]
MNSLVVLTVKTSIVISLFLSVIACSSSPRFPVATTVSKSDIAFVPSERVKQVHIELGKSNKSEVEALLGKTRSIKFENNYELWVYQFALNAAGETVQKEIKASFLASLLPNTIAKGHTDFVVLFSPDGIARKMMSRMPEEK